MGRKKSYLSEDLYLSYLNNNNLIPPLVGKTVAITGTTTGIGFALARTAIHKNAALVLLLNRESERSAKSEQDLRKFISTQADKTTVIRSVDCDLMSLSSVKSAAGVVREAVKPCNGLDVLCLNAGIMAYDDLRTTDGFDVQMQTNMLSHFLLTSLVYPSLQDAADKRGEARIVSLTSSGREGFNKKLEEKYFTKCAEGTLGGNGASAFSQAVLGKEGPWMRYSQSKLANAAFAMALHHKLQAIDSKIKSLACEPGFSATSLQDTKHMINAMNIASKQSASDGSLNPAMACFSHSADSGDLFAPAGGTTGKPIKVVAKGIRQKTGWFGSTDKGTCDRKNQELVWKCCEKALGLKFTLEPTPHDDA
jgi:NAD(P)-dependent dehydrogenase (short-subunit alcohol dehydrogenase family)